MQCYRLNSNALLKNWVYFEAVEACVVCRCSVGFVYFFKLFCLCLFRIAFYKGEGPLKRAAYEKCIKVKRRIRRQHTMV